MPVAEFHVKREMRSMEKKIIIKKYENRRLYDVTHSRYVNLDEIARAVQDGLDIQVLDASSGEDITRFVMTQIITECAKAPDSVFPLDILRQMVVASGKASQESALNYMRAVADMYKNALRGFSKTMTPFEMMQNMMSSAPGTPAEQFSPEQLAAGDRRAASFDRPASAGECGNTGVEAAHPGTGSHGVEPQQSSFATRKKLATNRFLKSCRGCQAGRAGLIQFVRAQNSTSDAPPAGRNALHGTCITARTESMRPDNPLLVGCAGTRATRLGLRCTRFS